MDLYVRYQIIAAIPELVVWGAGAVLCLIWSRRRPLSASMLAVALLVQVGRRVAIFFSPQISNFFQVLFPTDDQHLLAIYLAFSISNAIAWGLLLFALAHEFSTEPHEIEA